MQAKPRVLVVTPDYPPAFGGIQTLVHRVVRHADRLDARVIALPAEGAESFDATQPLDVRRSPLAGPDHRAAVLGLNGLALRETLRFRPQVVLSAHIVASPAAWVAARMVRSATVQYLYADELRGRPGLARFAMRRADAIIAISGYTRDLALRLGVPRERVHCILPGVDPVEQANGESPALRPTFITVGALDFSYKGHDVVLRALPLVRARVPGVQWTIVGDGVLKPALEARARELRLLNCVSFLGALTDDERDRQLRSARLFAMPSRVPGSGIGGEGFGIAYLEAGAHGLPVVAGKVGGTVDAVMDGKTGVLVDPTDHLAVADAISDLMCDPARARTLGRAGAERARDLTWPAVARRVQEVILQLAEAGGQLA